MNLRLLCGILAGLSFAVPAQAGCRLEIKGLNYQAVKCDGYTPVITEASRLTENLKKNLRPECVSAVLEIIGSDEYAACYGYMTGLTYAAVESGAAIAAAEGAQATIYATGQTYYVLDEGQKLVKAGCEPALAKMDEEITSRPSCFHQRPKKPTRAAVKVEKNGATYLSTLSDKKEFIYSGNLFNVEKGICQYWSNGKVALEYQTITNCPGYDKGTVYAFSSVERKSCYKYNDGVFVAPVEGYLCGPTLDKETRIALADSGACVKYAAGRVAEFLPSDQCKGLGSKDSMFIASNGICSLYREGQTNGARDFNAVVNCRVATGSIDYRWDEQYKTCYSFKDGIRKDLVANSFCGKAAVQIEVQSFGCYRYRDGAFEKLLDRGVDECPPADDDVNPMQYSWDQDVQRCTDTNSGSIALNINCGKTSRTLKVEDGYCLVYADGAYQELILRGEKDCPAAGNSNTQPNPEPTPDGSRYVWESQQETGQDNSGACNQYKGIQFVGRVANSNCGKPARLLTIHPGYCTAYVNGAYEAVVLRGVDDCPVK